MRALAAILSQHVEEVSFLWLLRALAVRAPHYLLRDLARLDERIEAHLDGLRVNGEPALEAIFVAAAEDAGAVFAAAVLTIEAGDHDRIDALLKLCADPALARGFISALGWLDYERVAVLIEELFASAEPNAQHIAIAAMAIHRESPGPVLGRLLGGAAKPPLKARTLRALGELGDGAHASTSFRQLPADVDPRIRFWGAWSAALTSSDPAAVATLQSIAEAGGTMATAAASLASRRLSRAAAGEWWRNLATAPALVPAAIAATGAQGDPASISWLIEQMEIPDFARRAGEAFSLITGAHIAYDKLERPKPADFAAGPTDDPADENVEMDPDEHLAWPDPTRVTKWWSKRGGSMKDGTRHLLGKPITVKNADEALREGYQRQRAAAAIELAILRPGKPLFEVRAPAGRQRSQLGL